jgi:hypothetical protein
LRDGNIAVSKRTSLLIVRIGAKRKHAVLAQADGRGSSRKLLLEHARWVNVAEGGRCVECGSWFGAGGSRREHQVAIGAVWKLLAQCVAHPWMNSSVRLLLAQMAHIHLPKIKAIAIT